MTAVMALAGRRVDAPNAPTARFPLARVDAVRAKLRQLFADGHATALVASAACGADLIALDVAREIGMRFRIVLPFDEQTFRDSSVTDRPGDWGPLYDDLCARARASNDLIDLGFDRTDDQRAYEDATVRILDEALSIAKGGAATAVSVSDGVSRGASDLTEHFVTLARERGMDVVRVDTLR